MSTLAILARVRACARVRAAEAYAVIQGLQNGDVHSFSSTQVDLPESLADAIRSVQVLIPQEQLAADGYEARPHVTVKYGLHTQSGEDVRGWIDTWSGRSPRAITVTLGNIGVFEADEHDVVYVAVESPELHQLNTLLSEKLVVTDTHPTYTPHATVAYVQKGYGKLYVGNPVLAGMTATIDAVRFISKDGNETLIRTAGGPGSGNFGHGGRPGEVGGSSSTDAFDFLDRAKSFDKMQVGDYTVRRDGNNRYVIYNDHSHAAFDDAASARAYLTSKTATVNADPHTLDVPVEIYHNSSEDFVGNKPTFGAYFGNQEFLKAFPNEWGPHTYKVTLPKGSKVLDLTKDTPEAREFMATVAGIAYPKDPATKEWQQRLRAGDTEARSHDEFYEAWTAKENILGALKKHPGYDAIRFESEYVVPPETLKKLTGTRLKTAEIMALGGPGSGNFGHSGRPGERGGSEAAHIADHLTQVARLDALSHEERLKVEEVWDTSRGNAADTVPLSITGDDRESLIHVMGVRAIAGHAEDAGVDPKLVQAFVAQKFGFKSWEAMRADANRWATDRENKRFARFLGGPGSGNFGHSGRPGEIGGSDSSTARGNVQTLRTGKIVGTNGLKGSANSVQVLTLTDAKGHTEKAIFKPKSGESWTNGEMAVKSYRDEYGDDPPAKPELGSGDIQVVDDEEEGYYEQFEDDSPVRDTVTNQAFSFADREAAAYELDNALGLGVTPATTVREVNGEIGAVQAFVEPSSLGSGDSGLDIDSVYGVAVLDIATGNTDRHYGNVLVDADKKLVAIDHGLCFPAQTSDMTEFRPDATATALSKNQGPMTFAFEDKIRQKLSSTDWNKFAAEKYPKMNAEEREGFLERMQHLQEVFDPDIYDSPSSGLRELMYSMMGGSRMANSRINILNMKYPEAA